MKQLFLIWFLIVGLVSVNAQYNSIGLYNPHFTFNKAELIPSKLGTNSSTFEMRVLPNAYLYLGNTFIPIRDIMYPSSSKFEAAVNKVDDYEIFDSGLEVPFLAFSYKINKNNKELLTLSLSNKTRVIGNTIVGGNIIKLLWHGNKQFEGQTIDLGGIGFSFFTISEFSLGWAMPLVVADKLKLRVGANFKYLISSAGGYLSKTNSSFETGIDGKYLNFNDLNYTANISYLNDKNYFPGRGFAVDISTTVEVGKEMFVSAAVLDLGSVTFKNNTSSFYKIGNLTFEGIVLENLFDGKNVRADSAFKENLKGQIDSNQTFSIPMPTRLVFQLEKNISSSVTGKGVEYIKHGIYLTYIQGLNNISGTTTKPYFSAGYSYSFKNIINVGPTVNYGGVGGFGMGMFLSCKIGHFRIGAGSNTGLSYLIIPSVTKSLDVSFMTTWAFGNISQVKSSPSIE